MIEVTTVDVQRPLQILRGASQVQELASDAAQATWGRQYVE